MARRDNSTKYFPEDGKELPNCITIANFFNNKVIFIDRWSKDAGNLKLLSPGNFLLAQEVIKQLFVLLISPLLFFIVNSFDVDNALRSLVKFVALWPRFRKHDSERNCVNLLDLFVVLLAVWHINLNDFLGLLVLEFNEFVLDWDIVLILNSCSFTGQ